MSQHTCSYAPFGSCDACYRDMRNKATTIKIGDKLSIGDYGHLTIKDIVKIEEHNTCSFSEDEYGTGLVMEDENGDTLKVLLIRKK